MINSARTKRLVLEYIEEHAEKQGKDLTGLKKDKLTAQAIAEFLGISRNLASQYLNEWEQEGYLTKTVTRPVCFFPTMKKKQYNTGLFLQESQKENNAVAAIEQTQEEKNTDETKDVFQCVIGSNGSIRHVIDQCKAAIKYPPNGLPVLLTGPSGSGKSYLARLIYQYAIQEGIITSDKQFVIMNCSEFANNPELLTANLFGYKKGAFTGADIDTVGLIQVADGGILFLDEVHSLTPSCQEKLFLFMDQGMYHLMGDNKNWKTSSAKLIFATNKDPEQALLRTLLRRIPVMLSIPSLEDRPLEEKEQLLCLFIQEESKNIQKRILISKSYFQALISYNFSGNIGDVKSTIRRSCANAFLYLEQESNTLILRMFHLPESIISYASVFMMDNETSENENALVDPFMKITEEGEMRILTLFDELLTEIEIYMECKTDNKILLENMRKIVTKYYDYLIFEKKNINTRIDAYETAVERISEHICERYKIKLQNNGLIPLIRYLLERGRYHSQILSWENNNKTRIECLYDVLKKHYPYEFSIAEEFAEKIEVQFDLQVSEMNRAVLLLNIKFFNPEININQIMGIVLSHGYSTASSIVDSVNKLLGDFTFEAIDMPLHVSVFEIGERLRQLVKRRHLLQDIILMVDMGSLEDIYKEISTIPNLNIGIINNITTRMVLEIGGKIRENIPMVEILQSASEHSYSTFKIIENRVREKVILFISETGTEAAHNIAELFSQSLPRSVDIKIIAYDYHKLLHNGIGDEVFLKYEVLLIAGTINPRIMDIPYIAVEDIIAGNKQKIIGEVLCANFSQEEILQMKNNMVINFSLQNVVEYLTILNAGKVLALANEALGWLQERMQIHLKPKYIIGLNVHISCLMERLIKKIPIETYYELKTFEKEQVHFIKACRESFSKMEKHYGVKIPTSEIAYIYDYFQKEIGCAERQHSVDK